MSQDQNLYLKSQLWVLKNSSPLLNQGQKMVVCLLVKMAKISKFKNFVSTKLMLMISGLIPSIISNAIFFLINTLGFVKDGAALLEYITQEVDAEPASAEVVTEPASTEVVTELASAEVVIESVVEEEVAEPATAEDEDTTTESDQEVINRLRNILAMHNIAE